MTTVAHEKNVLREHHAPDNAETGRLGWCGVDFPAIRWIEEDGAHVVISIEVNLSGAGDSWDEAFASFFAAAIDLVDHIGEIARVENTDEQMTSEEYRTVALLAPRLLEIQEQLTKKLVEALNRRRVQLTRGKHDSLPAGHWRSPQTPTSSSRLLPV